MLPQYRTGQVRAIGFWILSVLGRPVSTCKSGCMAAWCSSALAFFFVIKPYCLSPLPLAPAWGYMWPLVHVLLFLSPSLHEEKTQHPFIHSANHVWGCSLHILMLGLFLLHFHHLSDCRKSSWRAGAWYYLGFVEEVSLIVAFVKCISLETHWHINPHLEEFWDVLHSIASSETLVVKCASLWEILVFSFPFTHVCMSQILVFLSGKEGDKGN